MWMSMRQLPSKNCRRWFTTTLYQGQKINGLCKRTEMHSPGFCNLPTNFFYLIFICLFCWNPFSIFLFCENRFRPRILRDVSKIDLTTTVLGFNISMPIMIAPTAMQKMAHPEGIMSSIIELVGLCYIIRMILAIASCVILLLLYIITVLS